MNILKDALLELGLKKIKKKKQNIITISFKNPKSIIKSPKGERVLISFKMPKQELYVNNLEEAEAYVEQFQKQESCLIIDCEKIGEGLVELINKNKRRLKNEREI